jgi:hypothetical protein
MLFMTAIRTNHVGINEDAFKAMAFSIHATPTLISKIHKLKERVKAKKMKQTTITRGHLYHTVFQK